MDERNPQPNDLVQQHNEALTRVDAVLMGSEPLDIEAGMRFTRDFALLTPVEREPRRRRAAHRLGWRVGTFDRQIVECENGSANKENLIARVKDRAIAEGVEFFHDPLNEAYATVPVGEHRETWCIRSRDFELWVKQALYDAANPPPMKLVREVLHEFEMHAVCRGLRREVFVRCAEHEGRNYIDLANDIWEVIEVADNWRIVREAPVKFRRQKGMAALCYPQRGGTLQELRSFWTFTPETELLVLTWLSYSLLPNPTYPILALSGVQGAGKSTITRLLRSFIDPSVAALTATPRSEWDLAIAATNAHLIAMDNLSSLSDELSDVLCRASTGGSLRTRRLHTNSEETILPYRNPVIINGIEELASRPDLLDRCILIRVAPIPEEKRRDEREYWRTFESARPQLYGALLDVVCEGLRNLDGVSLTTAPRMADFARWGVAVEQALGAKPGEFLEAYRGNIRDAADVGLESSPIAVVLWELLSKSSFDGPALGLLTTLNNFISVSADTARRHPKWPKSAQQLSAEIGRIEPNLRKMGIVVERGRNHGGRFVRLSIDTTVTDRHGVAAAVA